MRPPEPRSPPKVEDEGAGGWLPRPSAAEEPHRSASPPNRACPQRSKTRGGRGLAAEAAHHQRTGSKCTPPNRARPQSSRARGPGTGSQGRPPPKSRPEVRPPEQRFPPKVEGEGVRGIARRAYPFRGRLPDGGGADARAATAAVSVRPPWPRSSMETRSLAAARRPNGDGGLSPPPVRRSTLARGRGTGHQGRPPPRSHAEVRPPEPRSPPKVEGLRARE